MRTVVCLLALLLAASGLGAQSRFTYTVSAGTGIALSQPSATPFSLTGGVNYSLTPRLSAGVGTGFALYDRIGLIPFFADLRLLLHRPARFVPYLEGAGGYSVAPGKNAHGGFLFNPSVGVQIRIRRQSCFVAVGYELQRLGRLKSHSDAWFDSRFTEELSCRSLSLRVGMRF